MSWKPDSLYLKNLEFEYAISLERYHNACNSINNLKTIISIIVSLIGVVLSLALPILLNKERFTEFFSINPVIYDNVIPWLFSIIVLITLGYGIIFGRLLFDKSGKEFDKITSHSRLSEKTLYTQYRFISQNLTQKAREITYKYDICAKIIFSVLLSSLILGVLTLLCLSGLGSGEGTLNLLLTAFSPNTDVYSVPMYIWIFASMTLTFNIIGYSVVLYSFAGSLNIEKMRYKICNISCIISFVFQTSFVALIFLTNIIPEMIVPLILNAFLFMLLPYATEIILTIYLTTLVIKIKRKLKSVSSEDRIHRNL